MMASCFSPNKIPPVGVVAGALAGGAYQATRILINKGQH